MAFLSLSMTVKVERNHEGANSDRTCHQRGCVSAWHPDNAFVNVFDVNVLDEMFFVSRHEEFETSVSPTKLYENLWIQTLFFSCIMSLSVQLV